MLAGNDKDALAGAGFAITGDVQGGNIAEAGLGEGKQAEVGDVAAFAAARAARGLAEDHNVLGEGGGDSQEDADAFLAVGDDQLADGVGGKGDRGGRVPERFEANAGAGAVDALEELLAVQGAGLVKPRGALNSGAGLVPGVALGLGEDGAPGAGEATKGAAHVRAGGGLFVGRHHKLAVALAKAAPESDNVAALPALGDVENLHKTVPVLLLAREADGQSSAVALAGTASRPLLRYAQ